jgi:tetratricopeptide (TPR) repeat protein
MATLAIVVPILIFFAALPASAPRWLRHLHPDEDTWRWVLWGVAALLAVNLVVLCLLRVARDDRDFVLGTVTMAFTWMALLAFVSVFLRSDNASHGPATFGMLLVLTGIALGLIAHDWSRRNLIVAAILAVLALGAFVVRVGFDDLHVPSRDQRQAIADAATTTENQLKQAERDKLKAVPEQVDDARATLTSTLTLYRPVIGQPLTDTASTVFLEGSGKNVITARAKDAFDIELVKAPVDQAVAVKAVADAVHAFEAAKALSVKPVSSSKLDNAIADVRAKSKDGAEWLQRKSALDIALASYKAQITGSDTDKAALDSLEAKPVQTVTAVSVLDALTHGPEALWRITVQSPDPLLPGPLVWVIVGLLALAVWGWLLAINAAQMAGPVSVDDDNLGKASDSGSTDAKDTAAGGDVDLNTVLRIAVLQNVSEPGASPGAGATNPVTDLLGVAGLTGFAAVVGVVLAVTGTRYGYQVEVDLSKNSKDPLPYTALVRVKTLTGGRTLASQAIRDATEVEAMRAGGLWAAGYVLNRSTRIPSWAAWNAETARALALSKVEHPSTADLATAVREAPNSGIMLVKLGHSLEQEGKRREAIAHYARAVAAHPRYAVARYRLAVGLAMMRHDNTWAGLSNQKRDAMLRPIRSAAAALRINVTDKIDAVSDAGKAKLGAKTPYEAFKALAKELLQESRDDSTTWRRLVAALRRSDRDLIFRDLARSPDRVRLFDLVDSARLSLGDDKDLAEVTDKANQPGSWWQVSYNAACGKASTDSYEALRLLEQTLERPGIHQLEASWVETDPDLAPLSGRPRFAAFISQLSRGT